MGTENQKHLRIKEAADRIGGSERQLRDLKDARLIPYSYVGRLLVFSIDDLDAYVESNRVEAIPK